MRAGTELFVIDCQSIRYEKSGSEPPVYRGGSEPITLQRVDILLVTRDLVPDNANTGVA